MSTCVEQEETVDWKIVEYLKTAAGWCGIRKLSDEQQNPQEIVAMTLRELLEKHQIIREIDAIQKNTGTIYRDCFKKKRE